MTIKHGENICFFLNSIDSITGCPRNVAKSQAQYSSLVDATVLISGIPSLQDTLCSKGILHSVLAANGTVLCP